ncbi:MAG: hypothetical protein ABSF74_03555 [Dehalococcoidia bacterium]
MGIPSKAASAVTAYELKDEINKIAEPYSLKVPGWELKNFLQPLINGQSKNNQGVDLSDLDSQIESVLKDKGINIIPRVRVRLERPPLLLVVSPRNKIEYFDRILLPPDLSLSQVESLENQLDGLNLSSLVVELGGIGAAYPALVSPDMTVRAVIDAAAEEWSHQDLAFRPLGYLYLLDSLGVSQNPDVITMNETLAGLMAGEIGKKVYEKYYKNLGEQQGTNAGRGFDFDQEMRLTRKNVDVFLAQGDITGAEQYMNERCLVFNGNGYYIRKLNQAYFAFHGIYGQDPGAVSPIYDAMQKLRAKYPALSKFVEEASKLTSYEDLQRAIANH